MDGGAFRHLNFDWIVPMGILALIGILSIVTGIGAGLWWLVSHLQWVS